MPGQTETSRTTLRDAVRFRVLDHLTTIPEDVSVATSGDVHNPATPRSIANLSTASAVASSDLGEYATPIGATPAATTTGGGRGRGKKRRQGSGGSTNAAVDGANGGDGDNVSDTHASLGGAEGAAAAAASAGGTTTRDARRRMQETKKPTRSSADLSWLLKCAKKSMIFYGIVSVLLIVTGVGDG